MGKFNKTYKTQKGDSFKSRKKDFGRDRGSRSSDKSGRDRGNRGSKLELHHATCDKCGKGCDLPFKPTSGKPVYCRSCFKETGSSESGGRSNSFDRREQNNSRRFNDRSESRGESDVSVELDKINRKLDKIMRELDIE